MLNASQLEVIKSTIPVLEESGELLTCHFYRRMFRENPEVKKFFNPAHQAAGTQQRALAGAICAYAQNIENLPALAGAVELIAQKHASLGILAEHYPIVGENLLESIKEVLGEGATPEVIDAWAAAYGQLADVFIQRESQIYEEQEADHGWTGFKRFVVARREDASDNIVSLYLTPEDGSALRPHLPGQYITLRITPDDGEPIMRNYSLSSRPGAEQFRISVKREQAVLEDAPAGACSGFVHDNLAAGNVVELAPPCGEFVLKTAHDKPLVLIAGGVGVTPLMSMLYAALAQHAGREVVFIQCALNNAVRPFAAELNTLKGDFPNLTVHTRLSEPTESDRKDQGFDSEGFVDDALLQELLGQREAEFYICGPTPMLQHVWRLLRARGVEDDEINYEFFGPAGSLA